MMTVRERTTFDVMHATLRLPCRRKVLVGVRAIQKVHAGLTWHTTRSSIRMGPSMVGAVDFKGCPIFNTIGTRSLVTT